MYHIHKIIKLILFLFSPILLCQHTILTNSNLPIIVVETDINPSTNQPYQIPDSPKVLGSMKILYNQDGSRNYLTDINNTNFLNYDGRIGIELRGSSSQVLDKKPYGFETLEQDNVSNNNVSLLGMPSENDWVLNSLAFDPSMIRDYLSYTLSRNMGNYAPRVKYVELVVNDDYKGVYILTEKIKIDSDRVDIKKLTDTDNETRSITGGYLIKADKTTGGDMVAWTMPNSNGWFSDFLYDNPSYEDITNQQANYIQEIFNNLANKTDPSNSSIINGYPTIIDIPSFIDYMIMAEISSNADAYQLSTYFHKDKGGKLRAGPIWDYNLTYGNDLFLWSFDRSHYDIWQFNYENTGTKFWKDLFDDATFKCYFAKRWFELTSENQPLHYEVIINQIDEILNLLSESQVREQERWGTVDEQIININTMKTWIANRINWISNNIGNTNNCNSVSLPNLVFSKIHYHPLEDGDYSSKKLEFIEITNNSDQEIDLSGYYISKLGISFQFPSYSTISARQKIYLCNDENVFQEYYGITPYGEFHRSLSNNSYQLVLADAFGNTIDEVAYNDEEPWPTEADGSGSYLQLKDINSDNNIASNWLANTISLSTNDLTSSDEKTFAYPNPTKGEVNFKLNSSIENATLSFSIYNTIGQSIGKYNIDNTQLKINLNHLKNGIYYYVLKNENKVIKVAKIIKN